MTTTLKVGDNIDPRDARIAELEAQVAEMREALDRAIAIHGDDRYARSLGMLRVGETVRIPDAGEWRNGDMLARPGEEYVISHIDAYGDARFLVEKSGVVRSGQGDLNATLRPLELVRRRGEP